MITIPDVVSKNDPKEPSLWVIFLCRWKYFISKFLDTFPYLHIDY